MHEYCTRPRAPARQARLRQRLALATTAAAALAGVTFAAGSASGAGITNLGDVSGSAFTVRGNLVAFANPLSANRSIAVYDAASGAITDTGIQSDGNEPDSDGRLVAAPVGEQFLPTPADLNGDGDTLDSVLHVYDADTATTTNTGLAVFQITSPPSLLVAGGRVVWRIGEADREPPT